TEPLYVTGGASKSPEIVRRVAAIWNKPVVSFEQSGAALGAAVAGAYAFLKTIGKEIKIEELNKNLPKKNVPIYPIPADVLAYHDSGGYLEKLSPIAEKVLREHPFGS
ncbi:MAG: FGGY-family carbohydrate kinase, partial [Dehalococcoidales bacterium]|nr:FGGY-family carbohydrate kinase [Dehalococcoidales bacterium]